MPSYLLSVGDLKAVQEGSLIVREVHAAENERIIVASSDGDMG